LHGWPADTAKANLHELKRIDVPIAVDRRGHLRLVDQSSTVGRCVGRHCQVDDRRQCAILLAQIDGSFQDAAVGAGHGLRAAKGVEPTFIVVVVLIGQESIPVGHLAALGPHRGSHRTRLLGQKDEMIVALTGVFSRDIEDIVFHAGVQMEAVVHSHQPGIGIQHAIHIPLIARCTAGHGKVPILSIVVVPGTAAVVEDQIKLCGRRLHHHRALPDTVGCVPGHRRVG